MRMWMVPPEYLCKKQLLGEAAEIHMFISTILLGKKVTGYLEKGLLEPSALCSRHNELVEEMKKRGMNHQSELDCEKLVPLLKSKFTEQEWNVKIDPEESLRILKQRCIRDPLTGEEFKGK